MRPAHSFMLVLLSVCLNLHAQFTIQSEFRNRFELRNGYREIVPVGSTPSGLIWQRTRLSFGYETENFKLKFTPQDVRLWGDESQKTSTGIFGDDASLELFEGYAGIRLGNLGWIAIGRQELSYDNQRLLAARNWNNSGMTYDALLLKLQAADWKFHLGSTWNSLAESSTDNLYPSNQIKNLIFLWVNHNFGENLTLSLLQMASVVTETDTTNTLHYEQI